MNEFEVTVHFFVKAKSKEDANKQIYEWLENKRLKPLSKEKEKEILKNLSKSYELEK